MGARRGVKSFFWKRERERVVRVRRTVGGCGSDASKGGLSGGRGREERCRTSLETMACPKPGSFRIGKGSRYLWMRLELDGWRMMVGGEEEEERGLRSRRKLGEKEV